MASDSVSVVTESILILNITSNVAEAMCTERRFPKDLTVEAFKGKLELITGATSASMDITVHDSKTDDVVCKLDSNERLLGSYPIDSGMRIHVVDKASRGPGEFDDVSKVKKFELSEHEYEQRTDTVRSFLQRNKMGKYNEEEMTQQKADKEKAEAEEEALIQAMKVGDRCEVDIPGGGGKRRGAVRFLGRTEFQSGFWVGVQYDEPLGKNDGSVKGKRYFQCPPKYGGFVKPNHVKVGDFPEEEIDFSDDEM